MVRSLQGIMLYWISNSKCKIFLTCSRASADKLKKAQTPIFKTGFLCRLVDMFFSPVYLWDFFWARKKKGVYLMSLFLTTALELRISRSYAWVIGEYLHQVLAERKSICSCTKRNRSSQKHFRRTATGIWKSTLHFL